MRAARGERLRSFCVYGPAVNDCHCVNWAIHKIPLPRKFLISFFHTSATTGQRLTVGRMREKEMYKRARSAILFLL